MPPLTAPELDRWERRFARSLEDLELLHASDGQLARRETKVRQARVRKQKKTRPCSTPKHSIGKRNDARAAYANDRAQLLEVLASDCGCALHAEGCYHALLERRLRPRLRPHRHPLSPPPLRAVGALLHRHRHPLLHLRSRPRLRLLLLTSARMFVACAACLCPCLEV